MVCTIDAKTERPGERVFERDLGEYATQHRGELVAAILTVIRAFIVAGCPDQNLPLFRQYTAWTKLIRAPLEKIMEKIAQMPCDPLDRWNRA